MSPWAFLLLAGAGLYLVFHYWGYLVKKWAEAHGIDTKDWDQ